MLGPGRADPRGGLISLSIATSLLLLFFPSASLNRNIFLVKVRLCKIPNVLLNWVILLYSQSTQHWLPTEHNQWLLTTPLNVHHILT